MSLSLISGKLTFLYDDYTATIENCFAPMVVKRTLFSTPIASFLFGASFNTYLLRAYQSMKFETRSGCKLLSISLCDEREYLGLSLPNRSFGAMTRIRLDTMSGPIRKLIGPAKMRLQRYVEEASSLPSSTVEEKNCDGGRITSRGSNCRQLLVLIQMFHF